ncbi:MAG: hypothetical protein AAFX56_02995 [Pseudomonadota bacterium]
MFKKIRIAILLFVLLFVAMDTWLTRAYSTDWQDSLYIGVYPINADGSQAAEAYLGRLRTEDFEGVETFIAREAKRYGKTLERPVRVSLGQPVLEQPPSLGDNPNVLRIMWWSLRMRIWAGNVAKDQERFPPDVRIFVRYHSPDSYFPLENSVGVEKGMFGIVNAYASRRLAAQNNVIVAHEFLHTLGASDKYEPGSGQPLGPDGLAEPDRKPLYPQQYAEIMGGRIALSATDAVIPKSLRYAVIGPQTAAEIRLAD